MLQEAFFEILILLRLDYQPKWDDFSLRYYESKYHKIPMLVSNSANRKMTIILINVNFKIVKHVTGIIQ